MIRPSPWSSGKAATLLLFATVPLGIAGCARDVTGDDYPSLARRAAEAQGFAEPEAPAAPSARTDPALDARISAMRARIAALATGFARDAAAAERAGVAARGRPVGSEPWLAAQSALAQLDDWRAQVSGLASEADDLAVARAERLEPEYPALSDLRAAIRVEAAGQTTTISRLQALTPTA